MNDNGQEEIPEEKGQLGIQGDRERVTKIKPGIYQSIKTNALLIIGEDNTYNIGHVQIRNGKYMYARWRENTKIREEYMGVASKEVLKVTLKKKGFSL